MMTSRLSTSARIGRRTKTPTQPPSSAVPAGCVPGSAEVVSFVFHGGMSRLIAMARAAMASRALLADRLSGAQASCRLRTRPCRRPSARASTCTLVGIARQDGDVDALDGVLVVDAPDEGALRGPIGWRAPAPSGDPRPAAAREMENVEPGMSFRIGIGDLGAHHQRARDGIDARADGLDLALVDLARARHEAWRAPACRSSSTAPPPPAP